MPSTPEGRTIDTVRLVAVGALPVDFTAALAAHVSRRVEASCRWEHAASEPDLPRIPERDQLDADLLLQRLEARPVEPGTVVVGVTSFDLAIPIFTFVFGRARTLGHAAVVSTARLTPDFYGLPPEPEQTLRRTTNEVLHELGHAAGLRHCTEPACLMRFAGTVEQVDVRGSVFCSRCAEHLPRGLLEAGPRR
jgi:archaemetzincin